MSRFFLFVSQIQSLNVIRENTFVRMVERFNYASIIVYAYDLTV